MIFPLLSYALLAAIPFFAIYYYRSVPRKPRVQPPPAKTDQKPKSIMQPPNLDLAAPKDDPFTQEQLKEFDGSDASKPIYVAIKGTIFDVTRKADVYGAGKSYNIFAGKDGSKGLGMSSLKPEDAIPDWSTLPENELKVLNDWHKFFSDRYNIVGKVVDLPAAVRL